MFSSPRVRRWLDQLFHTHDTPQRTAAAYALGIFFGFSPFLGLHTVLGLVFAFALNLNRVAVLLGIYSNLPWILPAYYTVTTLIGAAILRVQVPPGLMKDLTARLADDEELAAAYRRAHEAYLADREELGHVAEIAGISAGGMPNRVKCLHGLVGHALAAGPGVNPIGDEVLALIQDEWRPDRCTC